MGILENLEISNFYMLIWVLEAKKIGQQCLKLSFDKRIIIYSKLHISIKGQVRAPIFNSFISQRQLPNCTVPLRLLKPVTHYAQTRDFVHVFKPSDLCRKGGHKCAANPLRGPCGSCMIRGDEQIAYIWLSDNIQTFLKPTITLISQVSNQ